MRAIGWELHDEGIEQCGIVTASRRGVDADDARRALAEHSINVTTTTPGSSRWDVERRSLPTMLRLSVHVTTTPDELTAATDVLRALR